MAPLYNFNRYFNLPEDTEFEYKLLLFGLLETFDTVKLGKYENIDGNGNSYSVECKEYFGSYQYESGFCSTKELALEDLFIEYCDKPEIKEIVKNVYKS